MMATRIFIYGMLLMFLMACSKDDTPSPSDPDPIQQPDPKPDPENQVPGTFTLLAPESDAVDESRTPTFSWEQATDPDGDTVTYNLYLDKQEDPTTLVAENLSTTIYTLSDNLDLDARYYWKVVAKDNMGAATASETLSFTTAFPIAFLKEFIRTDEAARTQIFSYDNGLLRSFDDEEGSTWNITRNPNGGLLTLVDGKNACNYEYTATGLQSKIRYAYLHENVVRTDIWTLEYDGQDRLISVSLDAYSSIISANYTATFKYKDAQEDKPFEIIMVLTDNSIPYTEERRIRLEWEGDNILELTSELNGNEGSGFLFEGKFKYTYDNNISPYYAVVREQFGFDNFFVINAKTGLETINLGLFQWQSLNNITKQAIFDDPTATRPVESMVYDYTYTEDYYPTMANVQTANSIGEIFTKKLSWSY